MRDAFTVCFAVFIAASILHGVLVVIRVLVHAKHMLADPPSAPVDVHKNEFVLPKKAVPYGIGQTRLGYSGYELPEIRTDEVTQTLRASRNGYMEEVDQIVVGRAAARKHRKHRCAYCGSEHEGLKCPNCGGM